MLWATFINTLLQTYFGKLILNGVSLDSVLNDYSKAFNSGSSFFTNFSLSQLYYLQTGSLLTFVLLVELLGSTLTYYVFLKVSQGRALGLAQSGARTAASIKKAVLYYEADFAVMTARLNYFLIFGIGFASGLPLLTLLTAGYLVSSYFIDRSLFIGRSKTPPAFGACLMFASMRAAYFAIFCRLLFSAFAFSDTSVFPQASQQNLVSLSVASMLSEISTSSEITAIGSRLDNLPIQTILLFGWLIFLLVHGIVFCIIDWNKSQNKNVLKAERDELKKVLEKDERADNYLLHRETIIPSFTLPSYSTFKNADNDILKAAFLVVSRCK